MNQNDEKMLNWLQRTMALERAIETMSYCIARLPNVGQADAAARSARSDCDTYLANHGGHESDLSESKRANYLMLRQRAEQLEKENKRIKARHREQMDQLNSLKDELCALRFPMQPQDFNPARFEAFAAESVAPWLKMIGQAEEKLKALADQRDSLLKEAKTASTGKSLDEDGLLSADITAHQKRLNQVKQEQERQAAISDLVGQLEAAISGKQALIEKLRSEFASALAVAANRFTELGMQKTAQMFKEVLNEDQAYRQAFHEVCKKLIDQAGAKIGDVLGTGISSKVADSIIGPQPVLRQAFADIINQHAPEAA